MPGAACKIENKVLTVNDDLCSLYSRENRRSAAEGFSLPPGQPVGSPGPSTDRESWDALVLSVSTAHITEVQSL